MRNADATRERILEAAMAEFSANGIAGARVDRIAKSAGCNKNLIYIYFESKEALFGTILQKHLTRVYNELSFTVDNLPAYATRVFEFAMLNPDLMRLLAWSSLEQKTAGPPERNEAVESKLGMLSSAQKAGLLKDTFPPAFLLIAIMTLATAWSAASPFGATLDSTPHEENAKLREYIASAISLLTGPAAPS